MPSPAARDEELARARASYAARDADPEAAWRWSPLNPAAVSVRHQRELALLGLFRRSGLTDLSALNVADFGCGSGEYLSWLVGLGVRSEAAFGIDLSEERVAAARERLPRAAFVVGSADATGLPSGSQDLVSQLTLFSSVHDAQVRESIAAEMDRLLKPGGHVVWFDVRPEPVPLRVLLWLRRLAWWLLRGLWRGQRFARGDGSLVRFRLAEVERLFPGYSVTCTAACVSRDLFEVRRRGGVLVAALLDLVPAFRADLACVLRKPGGGS